MSKIKKDDKVKVLTGKDKGKEEKVVQVLPKQGKVLVEGINKVKKHSKKTQDHEGGIIERILPLKISNIALVCPSCNKATKVGYKTLEDNKKVRVCKKCSEVIDK